MIEDCIVFLTMACGCWKHLSLNALYVWPFGTCDPSSDDIIISLLRLILVLRVLQLRMPLTAGKDMAETPSSETLGGT